MNRRHGEDRNFYTAPIAGRGRMMREHGTTDRRFADEVPDHYRLDGAG